MFDREQGRQHLAAIAPDGGRIFVGTKTAATPFDLPEEIDRALDHAATIVGRARDTYVTPGTFKPGAADRQVVNAANSSLVWADVDNGWGEHQQVAYDRLCAEFGDAVFRIASGGAARYHVYVRLAEPIAPGLLKAANRRLVAALDGGDTSQTHAASWLRLAGSTHHKDPENVRRVAFVELPGNSTATIDDLARVLEELTPNFVPAKPPPPNYEGRPAPAWAASAIDRIVADVGELEVNDRHQGLYRLACRTARICIGPHGQDWDDVSERLAAASTIPLERRHEDREYDEVWRTLTDAEDAAEGQTAGPALAVIDPARRDAMLAAWAAD